MTEILSTLGGLISALGNVQSVVVVKEHVTLLQAKLGILKDEFAGLEEENAALKERIRELEQQLSAQTVAEQFLEERGAFFKRRTGGGYHNVVYCAWCRHSAAPFPPGEYFHCKCGWSSPFTEGELPSIMASLPSG